MQLVLISPQTSVDSEIEKVVKLFELGLEVYHLRKPHYSKDRMVKYIEKIPVQYHNRIMVHSYPGLALKFDLRGIHLTSATRKMRFKMWRIKFFVKRKKTHLMVSTSYHKLSDLDAHNPLYNYVFLSPVFDSISKKDYQSGFNEFSLKKALDRTKYNVFALGGVNVSNISMAHKFGFKGCALLGGIWTEKDPIDTLHESLKLCKEQGK